MSTSGHLKFQGTNRATFVGGTSNIMFDTTSTSLGIGVTGTDHPSSNLYITGNAYVSSNIAVGGVLTMGTVNVVARHDLEAVTAMGNTTPLTVEFSNATTGIVTTGNVEVGGELTVTGNATVSSNLTVSGNATVSSNLTVSGNVEVGTANLFVDTVNSRVGVGTSTPDGPLHISKSAPSNGDTGPGILFTRYSNTYGGCIWNESNNNLDGLYFNAFANSTVSNEYGGTPDMVINSNGRVGIGVNNPSFSLQVLERHGLIESGYWAKYMVGTGHEAGTTRIYFRGFGDTNNVNMYVNGLHSANDASDDRIKTDEVLVENATQTLLKLKPQTYTKDIFEFDELTPEEYSNAETLTDGYVFSPTHNLWRKRRFAGRPQKETGLIIQDIWYDAPELRHIIRLTDDAEPTEERPETEDIQQDPDYDSLGWGQDASHLMYQQIIPYLIKSNQELHARIQALENAS